MKFGVSKEIITPCVSTSLMGFASVYGVPFKDIHDDLYVRTMILEDEHGRRVVLMAMDLCFHDQSLAEYLREYTMSKYGIDHDNLIVTFTHTHFAPAVKGYDFVWTNPDYERFVHERAVCGIDRAFLNLKEGTLQYGSAEGTWNISRRMPKNGTIAFLPNLDGDRDESIYFLVARDMSGNICGILTNYACHPSNCNGYNTVSSEYPGRLCTLIEAKYYGATALFFQGAGSDTKLREGAYSSAGFKGINYAAINRVALSMLDGIDNEILSGRLRNVELSLAAKMFTILVPLNPFDKKYFKNIIRESAKSENPELFNKDTHRLCDYPSAMMWACAEYVLDRYDTMPDELSLHCGVIRLNADFYIATMGGEPAFDVKRVVSRVFEGKTLMFFGYNDACAYVPSDKLIAEGGYESSTERAVEEYRLKGGVKPGIDKLYEKYFSETLKELQ